MFGGGSFGNERIESVLDLGNDSDICGAGSDCVTMSVNLESIDQQKELVAYLCIYCAIEKSGDLDIDTKHALGKDKEEDLVERERFTLNLTCQFNGKESDGFQCFDDA